MYERTDLTGTFDANWYLAGWSKVSALLDDYSLWFITLNQNNNVEVYATNVAQET